jgi:hypothetical protein
MIWEARAPPPCFILVYHVDVGEAKCWDRRTRCSEAAYKILLARLNKNRKTKEEQERDEQEELALSPESWLISHCDELTDPILSLIPSCLNATDLGEGIPTKYSTKTGSEIPATKCNREIAIQLEVKNKSNFLQKHRCHQLVAWWHCYIVIHRDIT